MIASFVALLVLLSVLMGSPQPARRLASLTRKPGYPPPPVAAASARHRLGNRRPPPGGEAREADTALVLDLTAAALSAGAPPAAALRLVGDAVGGSVGSHLGAVAARLRLGSAWDDAWRHTTVELTTLRRTLDLAAMTGAPGSALLRDAAEDVRRRRHRHVQAEAARLGVRMVLPLGLCALPAFVAWAVVPVVLSLAGRLLTG